MYLIDVGNIWANQNIIKKKAKPLFYITYYDNQTHDQFMARYLLQMGKDVLHTYYLTKHTVILNNMEQF